LTIARPPTTVEGVQIPDAEIRYFDNFLADADDLFKEIKKTTAWEDRVIRMYGKDIPLPRRTAWYGEPEAAYVYSGIENVPLPWTEAISKVRAAVEAQCDIRFNSVLLNRYRTGKDSVAWHSDDEPELGEQPTIASVSLGATRMFQLKHKRQPELRASMALTHGSLLIMRGRTQANWLHQIPKTTKPVGERINLTFRVVVR
jgi:alkylated DNA repair dioxygenase AlkB